MPSSALAACSCCCAAGLGALLYHRRQESLSRQQRYTALATADVPDYGDDDEDDEAFEEVGGGATSKGDDLLNFAIEEETPTKFTTPPAGGRGAYPLDASSSSWVEEMNAELAEFDNLTGGLLDPQSASGGPSASGGRGGGYDAAELQLLDAELQAKLASPPAVAGGGAPAPPR